MEVTIASKDHMARVRLSREEALNSLAIFVDSDRMAILKLGQVYHYYNQ